MAYYGCARVSSFDQDYSLQEKASGTSRRARSELDLLREFLHEGVTLKATEQPIDTRTADENQPFV